MGRGGNWNKKKEKAFTLDDSIIKQRKEFKTKKKQQDRQATKILWKGLEEKTLEE